MIARGQRKRQLLTPDCMSFPDLLALLQNELTSAQASFIRGPSAVKAQEVGPPPGKTD